MAQKERWFKAAINGDFVALERIIHEESRKNISKMIGAFFKPFDLNMVDDIGNTALHLAVQFNHKDSIRVLLQHNANPNIGNKSGCTTLHLAAWKGNEDICQMLVDARGTVLADVTKENEDLDSPLHVAIRSRSTRVAIILLKGKANTSAINRRGETPLSLASQMGQGDVLEAMLPHTPKQIKMLQVLPENSSPVHMAARSGHVKLVQMLLDAGFSINITTPSGSALHEAVNFRRVELVRLLLARGINLHRHNSENLTAVQLADRLLSTKQLPAGGAVTAPAVAINEIHDLLSAAVAEAASAPAVPPITPPPQSPASPTAADTGFAVFSGTGLLNTALAGNAEKTAHEQEAATKNCQQAIAVEDDQQDLSSDDELTGLRRGAFTRQLSADRRRSNTIADVHVRQRSPPPKPPINRRRSDEHRLDDDTYGDEDQDADQLVHTNSNGSTSPSEPGVSQLPREQPQEESCVSPSSREGTDSFVDDVIDLVAQLATASTNGCH